MATNTRTITKGDLTLAILAGVSFLLSAMPVAGECLRECEGTNLWSVAETWNVGLVYFLSLLVLLTFMFVRPVQRRLGLSDEQIPQVVFAASLGPAIIALGGLPSAGSQPGLHWAFVISACAIPVVAYSARTNPSLMTEVRAKPRAPKGRGASRMAMVQVSPDADFEPFWFAVPEGREVFDPSTGEAIIVLDPEDWYLALEDLGGAYVIRVDDDRSAVLRDIRFLIRNSE